MKISVNPSGIEPYVVIHLCITCLPPRGWRFIAETCRRDDVCGLLMILYKCFAFVGVYG
jgi:hypothetical protein